jgi:hypothetical protein
MPPKKASTLRAAL